MNDILITSKDGSSQLYVPIVGPLLLLSLSTAAYTLYQVIRLRMVIRQIGFNIDFPLLQLIRKFTRLCLLYILNWSITGIAMPIFSELHHFQISTATSCFPCILFVNTFLILGPQCAHFGRWINHYDDEIRTIGTVATFHGLSFIIFMTKLYSATFVALSVLLMTEHDRWGDAEVVGLSMCALCCVTSLVLWVYCHRFNAVVFAFVSDVSVHSPSVHIDSVGSDHSDSPSCSLRAFWNRHTFYLQNAMVMLSSLATLVGAVIFEASPQSSSSDMTILWTSSAVIIAVSAGSMLVHYLAPHRLAMMVAADNKFRICCVLKTWLLMLTVVLVVELNEQTVWRMAFGAMSLFNILSVAVLTAKFDGHFWDRLNSLKYRYKFGRLLYWTYCVSLMTTNCCLLYIAGNAAFHSADYSDFRLSDPELWLFSIFPFVWIVCAVLYHNEFVRFQRDSRNRNDRAMATSMRSLYYFMNMTVTASFGSIILYLVYILEIDSTLYDYYMIVYMGCAGIIFVNGIVALFVLHVNSESTVSDSRNDLFLQNEQL